MSKYTFYRSSYFDGVNRYQVNVTQLANIRIIPLGDPRQNTDRIIDSEVRLQHLEDNVDNLYEVIENLINE